MQFRLTNPGTKRPHRNLKDVRALAFLAPGIWQKRVAAEASGGRRSYRVKLTVPEAGIYYVFLESDSLQLKLNASRPLIFEAVGKVTMHTLHAVLLSSQLLVCAAPLLAGTTSRHRSPTSRW